MKRIFETRYNQFNSRVKEITDHQLEGTRKNSEGKNFHHN